MNIVSEKLHPNEPSIFWQVSQELAAALRAGHAKTARQAREELQTMAMYTASPSLSRAVARTLDGRQPLAKRQRIAKRQ